MRVFLSYAVEDHATADAVRLALEEAKFDVFFDRTDLPPGEGFHAAIRNAIETSDLFVFLLSPSSIRLGKYTLSELELVKIKWPEPSGKILPVKIDHAMPLMGVDRYLTAVTVLEPRGSVPAEVVPACMRLLNVKAVTELVVKREAEAIRRDLDKDFDQSVRRFLDFTKQYCAEGCVRHAVGIASEFESIKKDGSFANPEIQNRMLALIDRYRTALGRCERQALIPKQYHNLLEETAEERQSVTPKAILDRYKARLGTDDTVVCRLRGITKSYRKSHFLLQNMDLDLRRGEITAVVGVNASGKTTLLRIIGGEIAADQGRVSYPALGADGPSLAARSQISYVQQSLAPWRGKVADNLRLAAASRGIFGKENDLAVDFLLHRYDLAKFADLSYSDLSGGYRLRFALARALVTKPKLLILDEPLAYLDYLAQQRILADLKIIAESLDNPVPIVITSQHLYEVEQIAHRVVVISAGAVKLEAEIDTLRDRAETYLYEAHFRELTPELFGRLSQRLPDARFSATFGGCLIELPKRAGAESELVRVCGEEGTGLVLLRDLTGSTRRYFGEQVVSYSHESGVQTHEVRR